MTDKEAQIAAAALRVFQRFGIQRATMNDIAQEAGVVRQTLYNVFANKDQVVHGAVLFYLEGLRQKTLEEWQAATFLSEKLDILFQNHVVTPWNDVRKTPDTEEIEASANGMAMQAFDKAAGQLSASIEDLFAPYRHGLAGLGESPETLADFTERAMRGIKHSATDQEQLQRNLVTLRASLLMMTGQMHGQ